MLKALLNEVPSNLPVFFRRVTPIAGNIEGAYRMELSTYSTFGEVRPCLIFEPYMESLYKNADSGLYGPEYQGQ